MQIGRVAALSLILCIATAFGDCGDGVVDPGEACDPGSATGAFAGCCAADCTLLPDDSACDDGNLFTTFDRCVQGVCQGTLPVCGDGIAAPFWEQCDDGPANGTPGTCCTTECQGRPYGTACAEDGDLCTHDVCTLGTCSHLVEPQPACSMPQVTGGAALTARTRRDATGVDVALAALRHVRGRL